MKLDTRGGRYNIIGESKPMMKDIFIVDDQPDIRHLLEHSLKGEGRRIYLIESGEEAIEAAMEHAPDLIIMDVMMPGGIDGYETVKRLKNLPQTRDCPIIMVTAKGQLTDREKAIACGADDYVSKPFSIMEIRAKVSKRLH